jgi:hypothetical protein
MRQAGWRPERRNRKLGTADWSWRDKEGARPNFDVPWPDWEHRVPEERWSAEAIERHQVHGGTILVATERPNDGSIHVCSPSEVCAVLHCLPEVDVAGVGLVVLRQPTRKEEVLRLAWGRMHYCADFLGYSGPAITLDAVDFRRPRRRISRSLSLEEAEALERLRRHRFAVTETRRSYDVLLTPKHVRRWLLARTIPHEVGHWVDYRRRVLDQLDAATVADALAHPQYEEIAARWWARPQREREQFADRYADAAEPAISALIETK